MCHRNICSPCAMWEPVTSGVCAVQVSGVHPQRPSPAWHRKRGSAPPAVQGTGAELKSSEELFSSEIRSKKWSWDSSFIVFLLVFLFKHDLLKQWKDISDAFLGIWLPIFWLFCPEMIKYQVIRGCVTETQIKETSPCFVF